MQQGFDGFEDGVLELANREFLRVPIEDEQELAELGQGTA
jgi:hypothetical protein